MKTNRQTGAALACGLSLALVAFACAAQQAAGQSYRELRESLLAQGWKPDVNYGLKMINSGKPLYRFPEVLCGPQLCKAKWRDSKGAEHAIMIQRGYNDEEYRVISQQ
ncbi:hypothetical protein [uncultured Rhodoblastus sp.]|uniref:hypothetical protein n=1 Tax=uncultured Rhodoblastus sp. TaxID=543037 RepID=UPI0025DD8A8C|nr:hypothetical protein [uncultured Rhodoblastus sp.]